MPPRFNTSSAVVVPTVRRRFQLPEITVRGQAGIPTLIVVTSGLKNEPYSKALLHAENKDEKRRGASTPDTLLADAKAARLRQRRLYPGLVVVGWENVYEEVAGAPKTVDFTVDDCRALLAPEEEGGIPDHVFGELAAFCGLPANFTADSAGAIAGNS